MSEDKATLAKYRKEALVLFFGFALVLLLVFNLHSPKAKNDLASHSEFSRVTTSSPETLEAANNVEEEQEKQSVMLSRFKEKYSKLIRAKKCHENHSCSHANINPQDSNLSALKNIGLQLEGLRPQLVLNWFRLNNKARTQIISSIELNSSFVKKQILELLLELTLDESAAFLPLVLKEVIEKPQPKLVTQAFKFIKKTSNPKNEVQIAKKIVKAMNSNDALFSRTLSKNIYIITSPNTVSIYKEALSQISNQDFEIDLLTTALKQTSAPGGQVVNR